MTAQELKQILLVDEKVDIDPEYLYSIKRKVESMLKVLIDKFKLKDYISDKLRYRLDWGKMYQSEYYKYFTDKRDINGRKLRYGVDILPDTFEKWMENYVGDYMRTAEIYDMICNSRRIVKDDLILLNKIARRYQVGEDTNE